jgi:transposase
MSTGWNSRCGLFIGIFHLKAFEFSQRLHSGARAVFLPAYSPDLNPIEQLFARLKSFLRKMKARTVEELWTAVDSYGRIVGFIDPAPID